MATEAVVQVASGFVLPAHSRASAFNSETSIELILRPASVETGDTDVNDILRSTRHFSVVEYPLWRLSASGASAEEEGKWNLSGALFLVGLSVPFQLHTTARHDAGVLRLLGTGTLPRQRNATRNAVPLVAGSGRFDLFLQADTGPGGDRSGPPTSIALPRPPDQA